MFFISIPLVEKGTGWDAKDPEPVAVEATIEEVDGAEGEESTAAASNAVEETPPPPEPEPEVNDCQSLEVLRCRTVRYKVHFWKHCWTAAAVDLARWLNSVFLCRSMRQKMTKARIIYSTIILIERRIYDNICRGDVGSNKRTKHSHTRPHTPMHFAK